MTLSDITVIIPAFNVENSISKCINAILHQDYPEDKINILLINDGSTDNTNKELQQFSNNPKINILINEENRGLAYTRNLGIKKATTELILFLDSDMVARQNFISVMQKYFDNQSITGVIGNLLLPNSFSPNTLDKYFYSKYRGAKIVATDSPLPFKYFLFNNTMIRKSILNLVGTFDEFFKEYGGEDTDLAIRVWRKYPEGLRYAPDAKCEHFHQRTLKQFCFSMYKYGKTNLPYLISKYPEHTNELGGNYIHSIKGYLIFNSIMRILSAILFKIYPHPRIIRYIVADNVIRGARNR